MKWSLQQLYKYRNSPLEFNGTTSYDEYVKNFSDILRMDEVVYSGKAYVIGDDKYKFLIHIETTMYLEDARTLEEVSYPVNLNISEIFSKEQIKGKDLENVDDDTRYIEKNTIDLYDVIWENIILEKPMYIVKES